MARFHFLATLCVVMVTGVAYATPGPAGVKPWEESGTPLPTERVADPPTAPAAGPGLLAGGKHIVGQQCIDGSFCWPHGSDCCPAGPGNITGPIYLGLLDAYGITGSANLLASAELGGDYDLAYTYPTGEPRFGTFTPYALWQLSAASGNPKYANHAAVNFFDALLAGTYGKSGYSTGSFITAVQNARAGTWINLLPWEFSTLIAAAGALGNPGQDAMFQQALLAGLNTLDNTDPDNVYVDVLGLAGAVRGLAMGKKKAFDPIDSPLDSDIDGIDNLEDLAAVLASYQNPDGSWYWHSALAAPGEGDKDTQVTAYAILALAAADLNTAADYSGAINLGQGWLKGMQLPNGGFLPWPGGDAYVNTEVEGEALSAMAIQKGLLNDLCDGAILIKCGGNVMVDTTGAGNEAGEPAGSCWGGPSDESVYFKFVPSGTSAFIDVCGSTDGGDGAIAVFDVDQGDPCNFATWVEIPCGGCSEDACGFTGWNPATCAHNLVPGRTYYIMMKNWGWPGVYHVEVDCDADCAPTGVGACCNIADASCQQDILECDCIKKGFPWDYMGDGTSCDDCESQLGACCDMETGACVDGLLKADCPPPAWFRGAGTDCSSVDPPCKPLIPTVSEWGLVVMTLIGLTAGTILFSRRRVSTA